MSPYFPFTGDPYTPAMGVKPLDVAAWLEPDDSLADELLEKRRVLASSRDLVLAVDPDPETARAAALAAAEVYECLARHLVKYHPHHYAAHSHGIQVRATGEVVTAGAEDAAARLAPLAALIQEDICLLRPTSPPRLAAGLVCFPSRWNIAEKVGLDASAIHQPVPNFARTLAQPATSFLERITPDRSFWRLNWTIHDSDTRFAPHPVRSRTDLTEETVLSSTFLRIERQTLRRLPKTGFVVFTIRTYLDRLDRLVADPDRRERMGRTLASMPDDAVAYKGMATFIAPLRRALSAPDGAQ
jgi:hypothetical protein